MRHFIKLSAMAAVILSSQMTADARNDSITYRAAVYTNASSGAAAPYMIGSWNAGRNAVKNSLLLDLSAEKTLDRSRRFSWGAGAEVITGYSHDMRYARYDKDADDWTVSNMRPSAIRLQTLYAEIKYRCLYALGGMKETESKIVDPRLSSGDLVLSNNARPIPGVTVGFIDFQDIPFTKGWLQIDGKINYSRLTDNGFRRKQFNYYNDLIATDLNYTYKYCYFRTKPSERLSVTFGMQTAAFFGGNSDRYLHGKLTNSEHRGFKIKDALKMLIPLRGNGNGFYEGSTLGSWSLKARYRLRDNSQIAFYFEWPWEDGSGIGRMNGWDGLWGLQYTTERRQAVSGAVAEYIDFRNMSGPLHWAPGDNPGTTITTEATGGDNYYNNDSFGPYTNYGMAIATPFIVSPFYNSDGYPEFIYNRIRGYHIAVLGWLTDDISYKAMISGQKGYAMGRTPLPQARKNFSAMAQVGWDARRLLPGLDVKAELAIDRGRLRGNNFGGALTISYTGSLNLSSHKK